MALRFAHVLVASVAASSAAAIAATACSSFDDADTVSADASSGDASAPTDAAPATDGDSAVDSGCPNGFELIERFDVTGLQPGWQTTTANGEVAPASVLPDGAVPPSLPSALLASVLLSDGGPNGGAFLYRTLPFLPSTFSTTYALRVARATSFAEVGCKVVASAGATSEFIDLFKGGGGSFIARRRAADGGEDVRALNANPGADWLRVELTGSVVRNDAGPSTVSVHLAMRASNGVLLDEHDFAPIELPSALTEIRFECGIPYADYGLGSNGEDRIEAMMDDLEIRACR